MLLESPIIVSASESLRNFFQLLTGGCSTWPCMVQEIPERAELISGDSNSDIEEGPEFDSMRLLSYNIFIRMFSQSL